jgi:uncharacterized RDD family membrane protein YckC
LDYHLSIAGERSGPHSQFHIIEGIRDGSLKGDELAWRVGMPEWQPLRSLEDFTTYWPLSEETLQQAEVARSMARIELDRPQPWMRFWARMLDNLWFSFVLLLALRPWLPAGPPPLPDAPWLRHLILDGMSVMSLLLYVPMEAWLLSRFGTTPGRALLRVQVRRLDGGLPHFSQALRRSFQVFVMGLGLGLPIVHFVAMVWSRFTLLQRGTTAWDESNETRVEHGEPEIWRYLVLIGVILGVAIFFAIFAGRVAEEMSHLPN